MRMCIVCKTMHEKSDFFRVVRQVDGHIVYDAVGKVSGRGAYLCKSASCIENGLKLKLLARALDCVISQDNLEELKEILGGLVGKRNEN